MASTGWINRPPVPGKNGIVAIGLINNIHYFVNIIARQFFGRHYTVHPTFVMPAPRGLPSTRTGARLHAAVLRRRRTAALAAAGLLQRRQRRQLPRDVPCPGGTAPDAKSTRRTSVGSADRGAPGMPGHSYRSPMASSPCAFGRVEGASHRASSPGRPPQPLEANRAETWRAVSLLPLSRGSL